MELSKEIEKQAEIYVEKRDELTSREAKVEKREKICETHRLKNNSAEARVAKERSFLDRKEKELGKFSFLFLDFFIFLVQYYDFLGIFAPFL